MPDVMTAEQRSRCMSKIRSKDTKPELLLRKALWRAGTRYRLRPKLPGRPDLVFFGVRLAVFVDGCFWHMCPVHGRRPQSNTSYWSAKIAGNLARDKRVNESLSSMGWHVLRFWEHEIKDDVGAVVQEISNCRNRLSGGGKPKSANEIDQRGSFR